MSAGCLAPNDLEGTYVYVVLATVSSTTTRFCWITAPWDLGEAVRGDGWRRGGCWWRRGVAAELINQYSGFVLLLFLCFRVRIPSCDASG